MNSTQIITYAMQEIDRELGMTNDKVENFRLLEKRALANENEAEAAKWRKLRLTEQGRRAREAAGVELVTGVDAKVQRVIFG